MLILLNFLNQYLMQAFPDKIKFTQTQMIAELKNIQSKDSKGVKLASPIGVYEYLDDGKKRIGKVTGEQYANHKIGSTVSFSLEVLSKLVKENIVEIF